jgi:hypothetical protein
MRYGAIAVSALVVASGAFGSTPESWAQLDRAARASCLAILQKAHGSAKPGARLQPVAFTGRASGIGGDSGDLYYALTIRWTAPAYTEGWLCLYDKHTGKSTAAMLEMDAT